MPGVTLLAFILDKVYTLMNALVSNAGLRKLPNLEPCPSEKNAMWASQYIDLEALLATAATFDVLVQDADYK